MIFFYRILCFFITVCWMHQRDYGAVLFYALQGLAECGCIVYNDEKEGKKTLWQLFYFWC